MYIDIVCPMSKGFLLVELMAVVAVLGVITAIAVPMFIGYIRSRIDYLISSPQSCSGPHSHRDHNQCIL